jgi:FSR family fosmidomycin resistance protein-like MFS transporter
VLSTERAPARDAGGSRAALLGLSWAHLLNDGSTNYLPGVLPAVLLSLNQPVRIAGSLVAALTIGQVLQPAVGVLADRIGGRSLIVAGLILTSVGGGLIGVAHQLGVLIALLLIIGAGGALFHPQALAGVRSLLQGRHGLLTAVFLVGGELGRGVWPTAASVVTANLGLSYLWIVGVPGVLTVPLLFRVAPRLPPVRRVAARIDWRSRLPAAGTLLCFQGIRAFAILALATFIPILWHLRGGSLVTGASIITALLVIGVVGNLGGGQLSDRIGRRPVLVVSALACAVLVIPLIYLHGPAVWLFAALLGSALFLSASTTILIGQDAFPAHRSMGSGVALGLANGIGAVLVFAVGFLVDDIHAIQTLFWILAGLSALSALIALALPGELTR